MIRVRLQRDEDGLVKGFIVTGHSESAPRGQDIVCAGVSALTDTTALSLSRLLGQRLSLEAGPGRLSCRLPADMLAKEREKAELLIWHMTLGLSEMARLHPDHVSVEDASN